MLYGLITTKTIRMHNYIQILVIIWSLAGYSTSAQSLQELLKKTKEKETQAKGLAGINAFATRPMPQKPVSTTVDSSSIEIDYDALPNALPEPVRLVDDEVVFEEEHRKNYIAMHEEAKHLRKLTIKEAILSKLGLTMPPNITQVRKYKQELEKTRYPAHIMPDISEPEEELQQDASLAEDKYHAKISTVITFAKTLPEEKRKEMLSAPAQAIFFPMPEQANQYNIEKAMLLIYIHRPDQYAGEPLYLTVSSNVRPNKPIFDQKISIQNTSQWWHMDITGEAQEWAKDDQNNYGLTARVLYHNMNLVGYPNNTTGSSSGETRVPLIKFKLNGKGTRHKRSFDEDINRACKLEDGEKRCCRYPLVIDFDEYGEEYEFIISPRRFTANYCTGSCPLYFVPANVNSQLKMGLGRQMERCCTGKVLKPLGLLYMTESNEIIQGELSDVTIETCGCA